MIEDFLQELKNDYSKCPYDYPKDLNVEPDKYNYFECLIGRDGVVYEAPNGHQRGLIMMAARNLNITPDEVNLISDKIWYQEWLLMKSEAVMMWHDFGKGNANEAQLQTIERLKEMKHIASNFRLHTYHYGGTAE